MMLNDNKLTSDQIMSNFVWKKISNGFDIGIDYGMFGFYNADVIEKISKDNNIPIMNGSFGKYHLTKIIDRSKLLYEANVLDKNSLQPNIKSNITKPFGVMAYNGIGDGIYECYTYNNIAFILLSKFNVKQLNWIKF